MKAKTQTLIDSFLLDLEKKSSWQKLTISEKSMFTNRVHQKEYTPIGSYKQCLDYLQSLYQLFLDTISLVKNEVK